MSEPTETVIIVGAGIVGSALAYFLSSSSTPRNITIIDRSFGLLLGSTGHAPGFVGQFNESEVLTKLAVETVSEYIQIPGGFDTVGGLEIAFQPAGVERLKTRCMTAVQLALPAEMLSIERAHTLAPELVKESNSGTAVLFPTDGTANACKITSFYQEEARKSGVQLLQGDVKKLAIRGGRVAGVEVLDGDSVRQLDANKVIITTGIWAQDLCRDLDFPVPVIPVGHPYKHGQPRNSLSRKLPFVRWPEHHVYARDHGDRYGIGSYNHEPLGCKSKNGTAVGSWIKEFEQTLQSATGLLPLAAGEEFDQGASFNGIFSMTPDNMPLAGPVQSVPGLHMAVAVWVTHAAGTAKFLTKVIDGEDVDEETRNALDPERFRGQDYTALEKKSLLGYNSIYKTVGKSA
ncbi:dimethylglycine oxidase [Colletotrichum tofieldiae]|uniref:Dimethylglycine oxidase (FAD dependent oxidoreductase) n=1 Tax=Colletotrichum tofieldiae TaxID=708197 RepID=A0A166P5J1_9PEZI|nr:Dimethylglycine oxidase (FAD dependent oxidoreductase) [Colletotrichum tofieldiae]GKT56810.1 dimethylglycine oxidase [Colletotrichum tofieldiae]GKT76227.1 dimethylglycine oxidase [Colletotrichum tofieldiae]GKT87271.1 dimethylglycine oxidase [Colletotrichum tofieldiae]